MSDSESDAPQAVSLSQSKKTARKQDKEVESFRAGEKKKEKERNRQRDLWLKEQASSKAVDTDETTQSKEVKKDKTGKRKKGNGNEVTEGDKEQKRLEARMARAMEEAGGEDDEDEDDDEMDIGMDEGEEGEEDSDDDEDMEEPDDDDELGEDEDEEDGDEDDMEDDDDAASDPRSKYLPDHIFTVAFSKPSKPPSITTPSKPSSSKASKASKRRKRVQSLSKDIILGSRTIRTLPPPSSHTHADIHTPGTLAPPPRINKFLSRTLSLKGTSANKKKTQGWERRAANLGVMKRSGGAPAAGFVRA